MSAELLTIASLNAEYGQYGPHASEILDFIQAYAPQILLLQEIFPNDIELLLRSGAFSSAEFLPQANFCVPYDRLRGTGQWGIGILTTLSVADWQKDYYLLDEHSVPDVKKDRYVPARGVLSGNMRTQSGANLSVGNIHFIWTQMGENTKEQKFKLLEVQRIVTRRRLDLLAGDFNVPRQSPLGQELSQNSLYTDHIPTDVETTLDKNRHRNDAIPNHVVDYLFSTPDSRWNVIPSTLQIVSGVSDHCAIVGEIEKVE